MRTTATRPSARSPKASFAKTGSLVAWTGRAVRAEPIERGARIRVRPAAARRRTPRRRSTPASRARRSSRAPSTRVRPVRSRSRRSRRRGRGLDARVGGARQERSGGGGHPASSCAGRPTWRRRRARVDDRRRSSGPARRARVARRPGPSAAAEAPRQPVAVELRGMRGQEDEPAGLEHPRGGRQERRRGRPRGARAVRPARGHSVGGSSTTPA